MELELSRIDYTIIGVTNYNCLKLIPGSDANQTQRVVSGDSDGILEMFSIKKNDIQLHFKTLPAKSISSVMIAGAIGTTKDKIFVAHENEVKGYSKKGKLFLTFDPGMTESIRCMYVIGTDLFLCGDHIYNHYRDCKGIGSYLCGDKIIDVIAYHTLKTKRLITLLACEGRMIRALEHARVTFSMEVDNSPTVLHIYENADEHCILFGTVDGRIGILDLDKCQGFERWLISNEKYSSSISCLDSYDLNKNGAKNLIVGRQDGNIEVYHVNVSDAMDASILMFFGNYNECITSLQCGVVGSIGYDEILVATYTGRIFGLTTQLLHDVNLNGNNAGSNIFTVNASQKIAKLRLEIDELQGKIQKEREKYQNLTQSFFDELSAIPLLFVKDSFVLFRETSTYILSIEVPTAIDNILLQSNILLELPEVEKNSAVVSFSECETKNALLATYRCQINTNRLELKVRTIEGQKGSLKVYVTPLLQPKCTRLLQYEIKPLSLHFKLHQFNDDRPFNVLTIKGAFSLGEVNSWISQCLPEVPQKPQNLDSNTLWYQSSLLDTVLHCVYSKGMATFRSENISTISVLKEHLTIEATKKKIKVDISVVRHDDSIEFVLKLFESKLNSTQEITNNLARLNALLELGVTDEETFKFLSAKYQSLVVNEKDLRNNNQFAKETLLRYYGTLSDLYVDYNKCRGRNVSGNLNQLRDILEKYSHSDLVNFFAQ